MLDRQLQEEIPSFEHAGGGEAEQVGLSNWSALTSGPGVRSWLEAGAIALVAVVIIGGAEVLLRVLPGPAIHPAHAEQDRARPVYRLALHLAASAGDAD